jgi:hypothetical protein
LGINDIGYDRLVFASEVFVQQVGEAVARDIGFVNSGIDFSHWNLPLIETTDAIYALAQSELRSSMRGAPGR